jgi:hypothetical protein
MVTHTSKIVDDRLNLDVKCCACWLGSLIARADERADEARRYARQAARSRTPYDPCGFAGRARQLAIVTPVLQGRRYA